MPETPLSAEAANALSGATDADTDVVYPTIGESPYYTTLYRLLHRLLTLARPMNELRIYKDGDLTFGIRPGKLSSGSNTYAFAGATGQTLTDNTTNYIYLTIDSGAPALHVTAGGSASFPDPAVTPHIPLATVATGTVSLAGDAGLYDHADITDYRSRCLFTLVG